MGLDEDLQELLDAQNALEKKDVVIFEVRKDPKSETTSYIFECQTCSLDFLYPGVNLHTKDHGGRFYDLIKRDEDGPGSIGMTFDVV